MFGKRKVTAIILVAGNSTRFGSGDNKNLHNVKEKPVLTYSLEAFNENQYVDKITVTVRQQDENEIREIIENAKCTKPVQIVTGGETRKDSVYNSIKNDESDIVIIHDGARPMIKQNYITNCIEAMEMFKGVTIGVKSKDTIKIADNNGVIIEDTIEAGDSNIYSFRLWIADAETYKLPDSTLGQEVHLKINVDGKAGVLPPSAPDGWYTANDGTLLAALRDSNTLAEPQTTPGTTISASTEQILASTEDDYGTSYYFRGAVTNNFVEYANMCWRIVRVTGDGSIKLVLYNYNGLTSTNTTKSSSTPCNVTGDDYALARYEGDTYNSAFNLSYNDNAYVGFMHGTAGASSYAAAHINTYASTILTNLKSWYTNVLSKQSGFSSSQLADTIWCNDKSVVTDTTFNPSSLPLGTNYGYAKNINYYSTAKRLMQASSWKAGGTGPSLICPNDNNGGKLSKFTVSDTEYGNGALKNYTKVGLLTIDEVVFAGAVRGTKNSTYYLNANATLSSWWTLSPNHYDSYGAFVWGVDGYSRDLYTGLAYINYGLRPSLSLNSKIKISSGVGVGSAANPYKITA